MKLKVNCPSIDVSKHITLIENAMKNFENLRESGRDITAIKIKITPDNTLLPIMKKKITLKELKMSEERLKYGDNLEKFVKGHKEKKREDYEGSIKKLLEIKDWKKARYEMSVEELNKMKEEQKKKDEDEEIQQKAEKERKHSAMNKEVKKKNEDIRQKEEKEEENTEEDMSQENRRMSKGKHNLGISKNDSEVNSESSEIDQKKKKGKIKSKSISKRSGDLED
jgi:hypothetical protein